MIETTRTLSAALALSLFALACGGTTKKTNNSNPDAGSTTPDSGVATEDLNRIVDLAPAGRVVALKGYMSETLAMRNGCTHDVVLGANLGIGVGTLLSQFASSLDNSLKPDSHGNLGLAMLVYLAGYRSDDRTQPFDLRFLASNWRSTTSTTSFLVFPPEMAMMGGMVVQQGASYKDTHMDASGMITTTDAPFTIPIPVSGIVLNLTLNPSRIIATVTIDERGLSIPKATLVGYVTDDAVKAALTDLDKVCAGSMPNILCGLAHDMWMDDPVLVHHSEDLVIGFLGDWDAKVTNGVASTCSYRRRNRPQEPRTDCNALSTCVTVTIDPVSLKGPAKLR